MIDKVRLRYFKRFREENFDVSDSIILAGPNNSGKSTLLQAIAVWNMALGKWLSERGPESGSKARQRIGVAITRKDFTAIPLREMNLLWSDRSTGLLKGEGKEGQKPGTPRILEVAISGKDKGKSWELAFELIYRYPDLIHAKPASETPVEPILDVLEDIQIVHVPPFSGIGVEETRYDEVYQDLLIGQGKPGDILRNLLWEIYTGDKSEDDWKKLCGDVEDIFDYRLLPPLYEGRPYIICEFQPKTIRKTKKIPPKLDIASAGSGFLQVLMLLGFFYARPASVLLIDEPDAHLHVILQKELFDRLKKIARERGCQLIIATHSIVLIDGTSPEQIVSFYKEPHRLIKDTERDQVREAIKWLSNTDILKAERAPGILYVESETDINLLREWARILKHKVYRYFTENLFYYELKTNIPARAKDHFFSLKAVQPDIKGILILDGDNRKLPDHEVSAEGLRIMRWIRYEAENYLVNLNVLERFVSGDKYDLFSASSLEKGREYLKNEMPPAVLRNPLDHHDYLNVTPASKTILPQYFEECGMNLLKREYYQIAAIMEEHEIPSEVKEKLDFIEEALKIG